MYLWEIKKLESDLQRGSLTQYEKYKYLMAFMIITAICMEGSSYISEIFSFPRFFESSFVLLATIFGTMYCYKVNKAGDNSDFIDRYICLYLPIFIRLMVLFFFAFSVFIILGYLTLGDSFDVSADKTTWVDVIFTSVFELMIYWKLSVSLRKVALQSLVSEPVNSRAQESPNRWDATER
jgi:hypothetical protein